MTYTVSNRTSNWVLYKLTRGGKKKEMACGDNLRSEVHKMKWNSDSIENVLCCDTIQRWHWQWILTSVCTCCFTAETFVKYDSDSEMFLIRILANYWSGGLTLRSVGFFHVSWTSWRKIQSPEVKLLLILFPGHPVSVILLSASLSWIIPRV